MAGTSRLIQLQAPPPVVVHSLHFVSKGSKKNPPLYHRLCEKAYLCGKVRIFAAYVRRIAFRDRHGPHHIHPRCHHCTRHPVGKNQNRGYHAGSDLDSFRRHCFRPLQDGHRSESAGVRQGIRPDPVYLFRRYAGRPRFLLFAQTKWTEAESGLDRRAAYRHPGHLPDRSGQRHESRDADRRHVGRCDQYARFGFRPANLSRHDGGQ